jgi:hypothetical protein
MRAVVGLLMLLAGCDVVLNLRANDATDAGALDAAVPRCGGTSVFTSHFDDEVDFARSWDRELDSGATIDVIERSLAITSGSPIGYGAARTNTTYDFRGATMQVKIVETFVLARVEQFFFIRSAAEPGTVHYMNIDMDTTTGQLYLDMAYKLKELQQPGSKGMTYDAVAHHWWRISHDITTNKIAYSTSPDGIDWIVRHEIAAGVTVDNVVLGVGVGAYAPGNLERGRGRFDDFELCRQ